MGYLRARVRGLPARSGSTRGQAFVFIAAMLAVLLGMGGIAVDVGRAATVRRTTSNAADAAALAGAGVLLTEGSQANAIAAAYAYAQHNGFPASETEVHIPPLSGPHAGDTLYVEVKIRHTLPTTLIRALGIKQVTINSRAVAGTIWNPRDYALVVLNKTACSAYSQSSSNNLVIHGGGAIINSSCRPSGVLGGGGSFVADNIDYYSPGAFSLSNNATTSVPPQPVPGQVPDPLASLPRPVPCGPAPTPGCIPASPDSKGDPHNPQVTLVNDKIITLRPGTYYGGIKITGSGAITFAPGLYVMAGGGFDFSATADVTGSGVTFFNTNDPYSNSNGAACASISIQGSGMLTLSAPTSDPYKNMLFWQADGCTAPMKYAGTSHTLSGIIYLPHALLDVAGGGSLGALQIVVDTFSFSGSSAVTINYNHYIDVQPPFLKLVE